ncbi:MAG: hypothetical protein KF882_08395 [Bacteroidia bacterium]|nr:hypothetical protein [Bacteroidia bacterium]MCO5253535.1 hypothetical protein [Bacteroidota bacterium]
MPPKEFVNWIEDEENGYRQSVDAGDIKITLQERPLKYRICIENQGEINNAIISESKEEDEPLLHFHFILRPSKVETPFLMFRANDEAEYFERLRYYTSEVENDIMLVSESDTLYPVLCHFERNYHVAPYNVITFAFENHESIADNYRVIFNDQIFNQGPISFKIDNNKKIPKLKPSK